jgi:hypothetical protein
MIIITITITITATATGNPTVLTPTNIIFGGIDLSSFSSSSSSYLYIYENCNMLKVIKS